MKKLILTLSVVALLGFAGIGVAADGAKVYKSKCASCHGKGGVGTMMAPAHVESEFIKNSTFEEIKYVIVNGKKSRLKIDKEFSVPMPPWKGKLTDEEIDAVVVYLQSLNE